MFQTLKRLLSGGSNPPGWDAVASWADSAGHAFKRSRDGSGFVIESGVPAQGWRLEWGPSQRGYLPGQELRLRGDLKGGQDLQMMIVSRQLMEVLEKQVFEQFTEGLQTRIDTETPEEMRWLVLYPKAPQIDSKLLKEAFGTVANSTGAIEQWLVGPLSSRLLEARGQWLAADDPLLLIALRGRLTLRTRMPEPDATRLRAIVGLFETALREGRRAVELWTTSAHASTQPSLFNSGGAPADSGLGDAGRGA